MTCFFRTREAGIVVVSVGIVTGIAINTAHELGHKRESVERWLSKVALAPSAYGHFYVEHNRGHHVRVATPEDLLAQFGLARFRSGQREAVHGRDGDLPQVLDGR